MEVYHLSRYERGFLVNHGTNFRQSDIKRNCKQRDICRAYGVGVKIIGLIKMERNNAKGT